MAQLLNSSRDRVLIAKLQIAKTFWSRTKGLLGTKQLGAEQALLIHQCNSVHTFFMKYAIDCIFVVESLDQGLVVKKVFKNVRPWRITAPVWGAKAVIEMAAGRAQLLKIGEGDTLYVGS